MKRDTQRPSKGRIAFEFVSPHGLPDGDELHVQTTGALVLNPENGGLWSIIGSDDAERIAIEILKARGKWPASQSSPVPGVPVASGDPTDGWPVCVTCGKSAREGRHCTDLGEGHDYDPGVNK